MSSTCQPKIMNTLMADCDYVDMVSATREIANTSTEKKENPSYSTHTNSTRNAYRMTSRHRWQLTAMKTTSQQHLTPAKMTALTNEKRHRHTTPVTATTVTLRQTPIHHTYLG